MKKAFAILLTLALCLTGAAFAEQVRTIKCDIEDGVYIIRLSLNAGEDGWVADDMAQDDSVVRLESAAVEDGCFVARYAPTGDGEVCVGLRHFDGIACDTALTWDLTVKDGAVVECNGGSHTESPDEADQDAVLSGDWIQAEGGAAEMTIAKNDGKGWNVQILTPGESGAVEFTANIFYDCELNELVYEDGRFAEVPVTDSDAAVEGEEIAAEVLGNFSFAGDEDDLRLSWYSCLSPEETVEFVRAEGGRTIEPMPEEIDLNDGTYAVAFDRENIADGEIKNVTFFTRDCYDIVDIATMAVGDTIVIEGKPVMIESLEHDEYGDLKINGGLDGDGYDLRAFDEDNCWRIAGDDDCCTYTARSVTNVKLDEAVTFTDGWDIEKEPETFEGMEAVIGAIAESGNEYFDELNTTLQLEGGKVVEIVRIYNP